MRIRIHFLAVLLAIASIAPVIADELDDAIAAYGRQNYKTALRLFKKEANQGSAKAQYNLGLMYNNGQGVPRDYAESVKWYRLAAQQGYTSAQFNLGLIYNNGQGIHRDYVESVKWYRLAAQQGEALAQLNLGNMLEIGKGVAQNYAESVKWYRLAALQGNDSAQYNLGLMYAKGQGLPQDYVKAHVWFNIAAVSGKTSAVRNRDLAAVKLTPAQLAEAQKIARDCVAASNGLLIRNRGAFEGAQKLQAIIFDKTGTLTEGRFGVTDTLLLADDVDEDTLRKYAASVDANSEHPIAKAIAESYEQKLPVENFNSIPGKGAEGRVDGKDIKVVSPGYLSEQNITYDDQRVEPLQAQGKTVVFVLVDGQLKGAIALANNLIDCN